MGSVRKTDKNPESDEKDSASSLNGRDEINLCRHFGHHSGGRIFHRNTCSGSPTNVVGLLWRLLIAQVFVALFMHALLFKASVFGRSSVASWG